MKKALHLDHLSNLKIKKMINNYAEKKEKKKK